MAKQAGVSKGRKRLLTPERAADMTLRLANGESKTAMAKEFGVDRVTVYRYMSRISERSVARARVGK